jgi:hypothetical protein
MIPRKVYRFVITNVKPEHEKEVLDALADLVRKGLLKVAMFILEKRKILRYEF